LGRCWLRARWRCAALLVLCKVLHWLCLIAVRKALLLSDPCTLLLLISYKEDEAVAGLAAVCYCGLCFYFYFVLRFSRSWWADVWCVCAGVHRAPQQPLASLNWLLSKVKRSSAYTSVLG
jgi:hypothetical protein